MIAPRISEKLLSCGDTPWPHARRVGWHYQGSRPFVAFRRRDDWQLLWRSQTAKAADFGGFLPSPNQSSALVTLHATFARSQWPSAFARRASAHGHCSGSLAHCCAV